MADKKHFGGSSKGALCGRRGWSFTTDVPSVTCKWCQRALAKQRAEALMPTAPDLDRSQPDATAKSPAHP